MRLLLEIIKVFSFCTGSVRARKFQIHRRHRAAETALPQEIPTWLHAYSNIRLSKIETMIDPAIPRPFEKKKNIS